MTSPSRVTTVTAWLLRRMDSASRALSATTVVARRDDRSSEISFERTCARSDVSPAGADADAMPG